MDAEARADCVILGLACYHACLDALSTYSLGVEFSRRSRSSASGFL